MQKLLGKIFHGLLLMLVSAGFFVGSFFYETNFTSSVVLQRQNQLVVENVSHQKTEVNRAGNKDLLFSGDVLQAGDIVFSGGKDDSQIRFSGDGMLRMADNTRVLVANVDSEKSTYVFKVLAGKVWLNNLYSNANLNVLVDGAVIVPNQSISYYQITDGQAEVYANSANLLVNFVSTDYSGNKLLEIGSKEIINQLFLPQGTEATIFKTKIAENKDTIAKLLFSKLIKEFNYSDFDKSRLSSDDWLSKNLEQDSVLSLKIRDDRLSKIRTRGLKYSTLDSSNYKYDEMLRGMANSLTFSEDKVGQRNLDALYDFLYDAQYLFDYGRMDEAQTRLDQFKSLANQLFIVYGDKLKDQYKERVKTEYEYLSFVSPSDSLYQLRLVLEKMYLESIKGTPEELSLKFSFLTEKLNNLGFFAEAKDFKNLKATFTDYMTSFRDLVKTYDQQLTKNIVLVQEQNQAMDNLFMQYPDFYRVSFVTDKLFVENKYLSLLPSTNDKPEEIQTAIAQRIDFLRKLEAFFLNGSVPLVDAQNIIDLLFSEISKIELPDQYKVAVSDLFNSRLEDYGVFRKFLNSPEYVGSAIRGVTMQDRFNSFKKDNTEVISINQLRSELSANGDAIANGANQYQPGAMPANPADAGTTTPSVNENQVTQTVDGVTSTTVNQVDNTVVTPPTTSPDVTTISTPPAVVAPTTTSQTTPPKPVKVPRVKRPN